MGPPRCERGTAQSYKPQAFPDVGKGQEARDCQAHLLASRRPPAQHTRVHVRAHSQHTPRSVLTDHPRGQAHEGAGAPAPSHSSVQRHTLNGALALLMHFHTCTHNRHVCLPPPTTNAGHIRMNIQDWTCETVRSGSRGHTSSHTCSFNHQILMEP